MKKAVCLACHREFPLTKDETAVAPPWDEDVVIEFWDYPDKSMDSRRESLISQELNRGNLPVLCENCESEVDVVSLPCPII